MNYRLLVDSGSERVQANSTATAAAPMFTSMPRDGSENGTQEEPPRPRPVRASLLLLVALLARCGAAGCSSLCYVAAAEQFTHVRSRSIERAAKHRARKRKAQYPSNECKAEVKTMDQKRR